MYRYICIYSGTDAALTSSEFLSANAFVQSFLQIQHPNLTPNLNQFNAETLLMFEGTCIILMGPPSLFFIILLESSVFPDITLNSLTCCSFTW